MTSPGSYGPRAGAPVLAVSTMTDPLHHTRTPGAGLRPLTALIATLTLVGAFVAVGWRWSQDGSVAWDLLAACPAADVACPVQPAIRQALVDPLLLGAGMVALSVGAFVDARRRPVTGLLLAAGAVALGALVVGS